MVWAYVGAGSVTVLFEQPVAIATDTPATDTPAPSTPTIETEATQWFQQGYAAFQGREYQAAATCFQQSIQLDRSVAEAHHNLGLVLANLRRDREAVGHLVEASQLYAQIGNRGAIDQVKHQLETLKTRSTPVAKKQ
ncbi:MAG: tetratricopeptide repeat protein [Leptolyngbyaceae cyanobacterium SL_7_1]|nr:tetratricopeptide repeat protein [Leptolyngbyaceae cyanobacterium SL_7_1]